MVAVAISEDDIRDNELKSFACSPAASPPAIAFSLSITFWYVSGWVS